MKSVNRKVLVPSLIGVVLVAPFLVIAAIVGIHAATLAANAAPEVFCVLLALASIAARVSGSQLALTETAEDGIPVSEPRQTLICESSTMRY